MDDFTKAYVEAALWSTTDNSDPETGGDPLDQNYDINDLAPETLKDIEQDCANFQLVNAVALNRAYELYMSSEWSPQAQAGHDFWLTRNGHGAGFWDRGLGEVGDRLTESSKAAGKVDLYVGDDGLIYS